MPACWPCRWPPLPSAAPRHWCWWSACGPWWPSPPCCRWKRASPPASGTCTSWRITCSALGASASPPSASWCCSTRSPPPTSAAAAACWLRRWPMPASLSVRSRRPGPLPCCLAAWSVSVPSRWITSTGWCSPSSWWSWWRCWRCCCRAPRGSTCSPCHWARGCCWRVCRSSSPRSAFTAPSRAWCSTWGTAPSSCAGSSCGAPPCRSSSTCCGRSPSWGCWVKRPCCRAVARWTACSPTSASWSAGLRSIRPCTCLPIWRWPPPSSGWPWGCLTSWPRWLVARTTGRAAPRPASSPSCRPCCLPSTSRRASSWRWATPPSRSRCWRCCCQWPWCGRAANRQRRTTTAPRVACWPWA